MSASASDAPLVLAPRQVAALAAGFGGVLLPPDDAAYPEARRVWNGVIDRRPALIARPRDVADVVRVVAFARTEGLPLTVRGGGHNVAGHALCGGVVLDLALMREVKVDAGARTARVQGGATWAEVDAATQACGLAAPGGVVSDTGVAGLTLGGGLGRRPGVVAAQVRPELRSGARL